MIKGTGDQAPKERGNMLSLDLATTTGFALWEAGIVKKVGEWNLRAAGSGAMDATRFVSLREALAKAVVAWRVKSLAVEIVHGHKGTSAAQIYGGLLAVVMMAAYDSELPYCAVPVSVVKRIATGAGNAKKPEVMKAASDRWPHVRGITENMADALWIGQAAIESLSPWYRPRWGVAGAVSMERRS